MVSNPCREFVPLQSWQRIRRYGQKWKFQTPVGNSFLCNGPFNLPPISPPPARFSAPFGLSAPFRLPPLCQNTSGTPPAIPSANLPDTRSKTGHF